MEGNAANKIMVMSLMVMMIMALLAAQARAADELAADIHPSDIDGEHRTGPCAKKCAKRCVFRIFPSRIALCFGLCILACKIHPNEAVFHCTSGCANSMVNSYSSPDAEKVGSFVDSCYETCKQNNKNY